MTPERCPRCGAAVRPRAPWCTLCWADLREPVAAAVAVAPAPVPAPDPLLAPLPDPAPAPAPDPLLATDPLLAALPEPAVPATAPPEAEPAAAPAGWPCAGCGARVPMELMACPSCGTAFLPAEAPPALPVVGDVRSLTPGARAGLMAGGVLAVTLLLWLVSLALGRLL